MFFPAAKIFWLLAEPLTLLILVTATGALLLFTRFRRAGRVLAAGGAALLALAFLTPFGVVLMRPLENRFPPPPADMAEPAGIIVLGGAIAPALAEARGTAGLGADGERMTAGLGLARRFPGARLVFTGGSGALSGDEPPEAPAARRLWENLGAPAGRMVFEDRSRNTWENALFTRDLLKPKPGEKYLLVTSAWHMPRSMGIFRRVGFDVVAFPVAYRTFGDARDWRVLRSAIERAPLVSYAAREWIGLLAYRLSGRTDVLFPAP
ncbi:YdcF family protein [Methylocella sp.]|uniref:YdcF family protein n=1 Tax=Methylocella sp. TaxID=1978226 RepID=UPI003783189E